VAGLIAALFGGKSQPPPPAGGQAGSGGYRAGAGPTGEQGFPGSTSRTRTLTGSPRRAKVRADRDSGFEQALSTANQARQASKRGDIPGRTAASPRSTPRVATPQPLLTAIMQQTPATNLGGMLDNTRTGARTIGGHPLSASAAEGGHSERDTTTPWTRAEPIISGNVPGSQNVRNTRAQRYKNPPGQLHTYKSAPRADTAPPNPTGWASDGNVHPELVVTDVTVPNRFVFDHGGVESWSVNREMPYGGRGDGARGADLNGQRYYSTGQQDQFWNAGQGDYGIARQLGNGNKRPVSFTQPAPWTGQYYDSTPSVEAGTAAQAPDLVYVSPQVSRARYAPKRGL
jgi:hypothetical protein